MSGIRVLIVDDSAVTRQYLRELLSKDSQIEIVGSAHDALAARDMIRRLNPEVVTLDIQMPSMDGLEFLERLMRFRPLPVIMFSGLTQEGSATALQALSIGAFDFVAKPMTGGRDGWLAAVDELTIKIKAAALCASEFAVGARAITVQPLSPEQPWPEGRVVAIGASTGGVRVLRDIVTQLPADSPPVLIAQHMPAHFTRSFANRLDAQSAVTVLEVTRACDVLPGTVYLATGDSHMVVNQVRGRLICRPLLARETTVCTPSVDILFNSLAAAAGRDGVGIVLTGMGRDGAAGICAIRDAGGRTAAQDEASSLIYGMPKAAVDTGAVQSELGIGDVVPFILGRKRRVRRAKASEDAAALGEAIDNA